MHLAGGFIQSNAPCIHLSVCAFLKNQTNAVRAAYTMLYQLNDKNIISNNCKLVVICTTFAFIIDVFLLD